MGRRGRSRARRKETAGNPEVVTPTPTSSRYTPPRKPYRFRPDWHRPVGWVIVAFGVVVAVVNDLAVFDIDIIPGGHSELYLMLALVIAGGGTWFLGLFDPPT